MDPFRSGDFLAYDKLADVRAMAAGLDGMLRAAQALAETRRNLDIAGLEAMAGRLCAASLDLGADDGRCMAQVLAGLVERLDQLEAAMARSCQRP